MPIKIIYYFLEGKKNDYKNKTGKSSFYPSIYRGEPLSSEELRFRWDKLRSASNLLVESIANKKFIAKTLKRKNLSNGVFFNIMK